MPKTDNAYKKNFDHHSFREIRPVRAGIVADKNGVYLTGFLFFEGDIWNKVESNNISLKSVFKLSRCKNLIEELDIKYSHKAIIDEERNWGMACFYAKLKEIDTASFKFIKPAEKGNVDYDGYYFRDNNNALYLNADKDEIFPVKCTASEDLIAIDVCAIDKKHVFFKGKRVTKSDAQSFEKIDNYTYEDFNNHYKNKNWSKLIVTKKP